ncbi:MAG: hypothetical protein IMF15_05235 [Proteobacteria bacterium]|nr:hypothetical protein [Pseudomonadota bacterium]
MQPRTLALIITILPLLASNAVYLLSAYEGFIPWCIPYIDGCTTISQAARSGNSIFIYRAAMIAYGVLLIWFWIYAQQWLNHLNSHTTKISRTIKWLGIMGAISLIIYIDFLGTTGEVNRFMRRYGIMIFFTFTPLAQLLMLKQHFEILQSAPGGAIKLRTLQYQLIVLLLMLAIGFISIILDITQSKTHISENIVEWNFSLLLNLYFAAMIFIWKDYRYYLK